MSDVFKSKCFTKLNKLKKAGDIVIMPIGNINTLRSCVNRFQKNSHLILALKQIEGEVFVMVVKEK